MPLLELVTSSGLGSLLGMRHALEPDHLAAVSTLMTGERTTARAAWLGACWGFGHTLTLVATGALLVALRSELPASVSDAFEFCVALMLVALGVRAIIQAVRQGQDGPAHIHHHGRLVHQHPGAPAHVHVGRWTLAGRPLLIGAVHGLAGSGALTALVVATLPSTVAQLTYMIVFGLGSTVGMAALSGVVGWPLGRMASRPVLTRTVSLAVGCITTTLGLWWGYPLVARLF
jgi:hypothetical protein